MTAYIAKQAEQMPKFLHIKRIILAASVEIPKNPKPKFSIESTK